MLPTAFARKLCPPSLALALCLVTPAGRDGDVVRAQDSKTPELQRRSDNRVVISKAQLSPPLETDLRALRFSPDGSRILLQNESTVYVISRNPLAIEMTAPARYALPARFTADSTSVVVAMRDRTVARWSIADRKIADTKTLGTGADCDFAALSPMATYFACLGTRLDFHVFEVSSGTEVYSAKTGDAPGLYSFYIEPFHAGLSRSEPFGYFFGGQDPFPFAVMARATNIRFSPDERYVLARGFNRQFTLADLHARQKVSLNGSLRRAAEEGALQFIAPGRVAVISPTKPGDSVLQSFPDGAVLANLDITGSVQPTSDSNYVVHIAAGNKDKQVDLLNIETRKTVAQVSRDGTDALGNDVVTYLVGTGLVLARLGMGQKPLLARIPAGPLPTLETAIASPGLDTLILSAQGQGAAYRVRDGTQVTNFPGLHGAWFDDEKHAIVRVSDEQPVHSLFKSLDVEAGEVGMLWPRNDLPVSDETLDSGPVVLNEGQRAFGSILGARRLGYELRGLDLKTGKVLWSHDFGSNGGSDEAPVTFTDPQGERVVVGWDGDSLRGRKAAKRNAVALENMKAKKATAHDSVFEVLNARTGVTEGVAFVPGGTGPQGYTSAYSAGNWLIVVKDNMRITVVSLAEGDERLHLTAQDSALFAPAGLLAVSEGAGRVQLYDLVRGARKDRYSFPENIAYMRFSADGKRLLVLTEYQNVSVIDLTEPAAAPSAPLP
jgi:hypothetical protein